eukprot:5429162-Alexandrium_andersonii.AAC.1
MQVGYAMHGRHREHLQCTHQCRTLQHASRTCPRTATPVPFSRPPVLELQDQQVKSNTVFVNYLAGHQLRGATLLCTLAQALDLLHEVLAT